jgi:hypothetical protein
MLNFAPLRSKRQTYGQMAAAVTIDDLRRATHAMIDAQWRLIADCADADVIFVPSDPQAHDTYASATTDVHSAWTLGHVIVHTTASAEESAFLAAELARGVSYHGRSRWEVPWPGVITLAQCRARLEESRRMRLATLDVWPTAAHLTNAYVPDGAAPGYEPITPINRFIRGLGHDDAHLAQIAEIVRQAKAAR